MSRAQTIAAERLIAEARAARDLVVADPDRNGLKSPDGYIRVHPCSGTWSDADALFLEVEGDRLAIPLSWVPIVRAALTRACILATDPASAPPSRD